MNNTIFSKIAGVSFDGRQALVRNLSIGNPLILVREQNNQYDGNAIKVTTIGGTQLGYIRAKLATELAPLMDRGIKLSCKVLEVTGSEDRNFGCNILIREDGTRGYGKRPKYDRWRGDCNERQICEIR